LSRTSIRIVLSEGADGDREAKTLNLPWTPSSPYRRREIIPSEDRTTAAVRPMRSNARLILIASLRKAHRWRDELINDPRQTVAALASREGKTERSLLMTLSLAFLAPDLVKAAIEGRLPRGLGLKRLVDLPIAWSEQWRALGLQAPAFS
ncbi:MAG TPA: recombinase family protein, partial [Roseiarcus sp.]|nr:recombinase family protein [Roseiarcus sp.]